MRLFKKEKKEFTWTNVDLYIWKHALPGVSLGCNKYQPVIILLDRNRSADALTSLEKLRKKFDVSNEQWEWHIPLSTSQLQ